MDTASNRGPRVEVWIVRPAPAEWILAVCNIVTVRQNVEEGYLFECRIRKNFVHTRACLVVGAVNVVALDVQVVVNRWMGVRVVKNNERWCWIVQISHVEDA